jgi:hypothetical protein
MPADDRNPPPDPLEQETGEPGSVPGANRAMIPDRAVIATAESLGATGTGNDPAGRTDSSD